MPRMGGFIVYWNSSQPKSPLPGPSAPAACWSSSNAGQSALRGLLFEQSWWKERLSCLDVQPPSVLLHVREDLCTPLVEVVEFRLRTPDGLRLVGLRARRRFGPPPTATLVRVVQPQDCLEHDMQSLDLNYTDLVVQLPPSHTLEQRVVDLLLTLRYAEQDAAPASFYPSNADEVAIAAHLHEVGLG